MIDAWRGGVFATSKIDLLSLPQTRAVPPADPGRLRRARLAAENVALRQQLIVLHRREPRPSLRSRDRFSWLALRRI